MNHPVKRPVKRRRKGPPTPEAIARAREAARLPDGTVEPFALLAALSEPMGNWPVRPKR